MIGEIVVMKKKWTHIRPAALLLLVFALCTACGGLGRATSIRLARMDGSVNVWNDRQKELDPVEDMGLYSGYQMETQEASYAWINLDSAKLAKMDQTSDIEIRKSKKDLEILLKSGNLYFNVTEPLKEDETMHIRTSTMGVGIRGTCGWVEVPDRNHMVVYILDGTVECAITDPDTQETTTASVSAGQTAVLSTQDGRNTITVEPFGKASVPSFVMGELDDAMLQAFLPGLAPSDTFAQLQASGRPMLIKTAAPGDEVSAQASVDAYAVQPDLSNIDNLWQFYLNDNLSAKLVQNGFAVTSGGGSEFFEVYESNRYGKIASFVTVDSLMHTYHLYFSYLMKNIEKNQLSGNLAQLSRRMLDNSIAQYNSLQGSEWESAALRNVAFFTVGARLLDDSAPVNDAVAGTVQHELNLIGSAQGIDTSEITGSWEDYSQYTPRGYYEGDAVLERYFRAMMWYGRIHFVQNKEDLDRSSLLIAKALIDDSEAYRLWESIYAVTSFFAGASDDMGVCEYRTVLRETYGESFSVESLIGSDATFEKFHSMTATLTPPSINSSPIMDGEDNVIRGFRFMGQRFTIDAAIMQQLIYQNVQENNSGGRRMLPDTLDVPAALGSDTALHILTESGSTDYPGYTDNMNSLRKWLAAENNGLWSASLYSGWLNTLRPLLSAKGAGYPAFMQTEEWAKKNLECFAGSFAELKHDTILYSKQVMAEMGGDGDDRVPDDRGYVEPEPVVYARFSDLSRQTAQGLKEYGMLSAEDEENLTRLSYIADQLLAISNKELQEESLTEEEYEFIRLYGGNLEHFWRDALRDADGPISTREYPAAIVADIATDPNGQVLEVATGNPSRIYVIVKVEGKLKIATGSVYTFYQFPWDMSDRLTDTKWRQMMGLQADDNGNYNYGPKPVKQPEWTDSYRCRNDWE